MIKSKYKRMIAQFCKVPHIFTFNYKYKIEAKKKALVHFLALFAKSN